MAVGGGGQRGGVVGRLQPIRGQYRGQVTNQSSVSEATAHLEDGEAGAAVVHTGRGLAVSGRGRALGVRGGVGGARPARGLQPITAQY